MGLKWEATLTRWLQFQSRKRGVSKGISRKNEGNCNGLEKNSCNSLIYSGKIFSWLGARIHALPGPYSDSPQALLMLRPVVIQSLFGPCTVFVQSLFGLCSVSIQSLFRLCSVSVQTLFGLCSVSGSPLPMPRSMTYAYFLTAI